MKDIKGKLWFLTLILVLSIVMTNASGSGSATIYVDHCPPIGDGNILDQSYVAGSDPLDSYPSDYATDATEKTAYVITNPTYAYDKNEETATTFTIPETEVEYSVGAVVTNGTEATDHTLTHASDDSWYQINSTGIGDIQEINSTLIYHTDLDPTAIPLDEIYVTAEGHVENATLGSVNISIYDYNASAWEIAMAITGESDPPGPVEKLIASDPDVDDFISAGEMKLRIFFSENTTGQSQSVYLDEVFISLRKGMPVYYEVTTFNATATFPRTPFNVVSLNFTMKYNVTVHDSTYRILYYVGSEFNVLQGWTSTNTTALQTWSLMIEPNDYVWNLTDISNIRFRVEIKPELYGTGTFEEYEAWVSIPTDRLLITINVSDVMDLYTFQFRLSWNGPVLDVSGFLFFGFLIPQIYEGPFLEQGGVTSFSAKAYNAPNTDPTGETDYMYVSNTLTGVSEGVDGSGVLAIAEFIVEDYGTSDLQLYSTQLISSLGAQIDHTSQDGYFSNKIPGDVNGNRIVDVSDLFELSKAYESVQSDPNWNPDCDFNRDYIVDDSDLSELSKNYGKTT